MNKNKQFFLGLLSALFVGSFSPTPLQAENHPYSSPKPMPVPQVFAEEIISTSDYESHPAFTPDGRSTF